MHNQLKITGDGQSSTETEFLVNGKNQKDGGSEKTVEVLADELQPEYLDRTMKKSMRWLMLILCCLFVVANYFCYDNPAALETYIEQNLNVSPS